MRVQGPGPVLELAHSLELELGLVDYSTVLVPKLEQVDSTELEPELEPASVQVLALALVSSKALAQVLVLE